jgi:hypothetical protein
MGGVEIGVGVLFADVRGLHDVGRAAGADAVATLLNRFYATAVDVMSSRVHHRAVGLTAGAEPRELSLKGKSEPEIAMVCRLDLATPPAQSQA